MLYIQNGPKVWCGVISAADPCPIVRDAARGDIPSFPLGLCLKSWSPTKKCSDENLSRGPIPKSLLPCDGQRRDGDFPNRVRLVCENEGRVPDRGMDSRPGREAKCAPGGRARLEMEAMIPHIKTVRGRNGGNTGASGMGASQNREQSSPDLESCDRRPP